MLYLAFVTRRDDADDRTITELSRQWWNEGTKPVGLRTVAIYGALGTDSHDVFVFEADDHRDLQAMVDHWRSIAELDICPAVDLAQQWRDYGMDVQ